MGELTTDFQDMYRQLDEFLGGNLPWGAEAGSYALGGSPTGSRTKAVQVMKGNRPVWVDQYGRRFYKSRRAQYIPLNPAKGIPRLLRIAKRYKRLHSMLHKLTPHRSSRRGGGGGYFRRGKR